MKKEYVVYAAVSYMVEAEDEKEAINEGYDKLKYDAEYVDIDEISAEEGGSEA